MTPANRSLPAALQRTADTWNQFWFAPGSAVTLGICRVLFFGGLALWLLPHDFSAWGEYSSVFWMPIWLFDTLGIPQVATGTIASLQIVWKIALVLSVVGLFAPAAMWVTFVLGTYLLGLPQNYGYTQHFDTLVVFVSGALALSRAGDACSLDAVIAAIRRRRIELPQPSGEYTWPIRFVWVAIAVIFCAAGLSKLRHSGLEWVFSDNMMYLLQRQQYHISDGEPLTSWGLAIAHHPWLARALAAAALSTETLFPLALVSRRARVILVPASLALLAGIRLLMGPTFEQFILCYVFWIPWERVTAAVRSRLQLRPSHLVIYDGGCGLCARSVVALSRLDLFKRLRFADLNADWHWLSHEYPRLNREACVTQMHVISADGRVFPGFDGYRSMARVVPLAWLTLPFLYIPGVPAVGERAYRFVASRRSTTTCAVPAAASPYGK